MNKRFNSMELLEKCELVENDGVCRVVVIEALLGCCFVEDVEGFLGGFLVFD